MKRAGLLVLACAALCQSAVADQPLSESHWPAATQTAKPWTRWWWPGSAVTPEGLTSQLEAFAAAGIGGVEITPIYGARGAESQYIDFLSPRWVEMLAHVTREARRLGLGVDMATGTGWPFGGPGVSRADGSSSLALVDGRLSGKPTEMKVKRPAPGGEGLVLDPYFAPGLERYLQPFTRALGALPKGALRSQFHDSFEYFGASWTPMLPGAFLALNGYDIQQYAAEVAGARPMDAETLGRIKGDYRRTLARLHLGYLETWVKWSHAQGFQARNQAHGAPANLLDLYAASDIPETESFGATRLPVAGLRQDAADINEDPDPPIGLIARFASSAAHVTGKTLVSSETLTWLRENFRETPSAAKPQLDRLFLSGINHIFYHGATYSPQDAAWPGWFFYAATQLNPSNPLWRDFGAMHAYVTRVQSVLQQGRPDNAVLFYWPQADLDDEPSGLMRQYGMHDNAWSKDSPAGKLALQLLEAGYSFDFVSDAQLQALRANPGYACVVVPRTGRMPVETLRALSELAGRGVKVIFEALPTDVPGFGNLERRRVELARLLAGPAIREAVVAPELVRDLDALGGRREELASLGLRYIRRTRGREGNDYFVANLTGKRIAAWVTLNSPKGLAVLMDPLTGAVGLAANDPKSRQPRVYLQLDSGQSLIVRTHQRPVAAPWNYFEPGEARELTGHWRVEFLGGGPALPPPATLDQLASWSSLPLAANFSGTARYRLAFDSPGGAQEWLLQLGDVRESALVMLNGRVIGAVWTLPTDIRLDALRATGNELEIEVTNLPANRVRDLDRRKVDWKIMKDINLASLRYKALDASTWEPAPSGLLGPVRLAPLRRVEP